MGMHWDLLISRLNDVAVILEFNVVQLQNYWSWMYHLESLGLEVRGVLGSGSFAQVYECFDPKESRLFAVKMIKKQSVQSKIRHFAKEAQILASIDHKNIVKFYSFLETDQCLIIKMQLIRGGTLKHLIEQRKKSRTPFSQQEIAVFFRQLLEGIRYLHSLNIIHRDLKTENILFEDANDLASVKIVDFGLSAKLEIHNPTNIKAQCGTLLYMAPEIFNRPSYTKSVDLWSCAVILFMLFNEGRHPYYYAGMKTEEFKMKLKNQSFPKLPHPLAQNFMEKISKREYQERYNVNDALKHPWITRNNDDQIPLSIHESFRGFASTNHINALFRLFLALGQAVPHVRAEVSEAYRFRVLDFARSNQAVRVYSPSRRKMKDKNNELFNKMKQIFNVEEVANPSDVLALSENYAEETSPTLKKHQSFFQSLFEKQKSFDMVRPAERFQIRKIQLKNLHNNFELLDKQEILFNLKVKRKKSPQQNEREKLMPMTTIEKELQAKIEHHIENCVKNTIKGFHRTHQYSKKRIFHKKPSIEQRQDPRPILKMSKKFSHEGEKGERKKDHDFSLSTKQIYTRRTMSPVKNCFNKHMVFNIGSKNLSYTARK